MAGPRYGKELFRSIGCLIQLPPRLNRHHFIFITMKDEQRNRDVVDLGYGAEFGTKESANGKWGMVLSAIFDIEVKGNSWIRAYDVRLETRSTATAHSSEHTKKTTFPRSTSWRDLR